MVQSAGPAFEGLYGQVIMDHYRSPRNREPLPDATLSAHELNPFCGDLVNLQLRLDSAGVVAAVYAHSEGCSIIQASASLMSEAVHGKTPSEAQLISASIRAFLRDRGRVLREEPPSELGDLGALGVVRDYPVRVKCALLPWVALEQALRGL